MADPLRSLKYIPWRLLFQVSAITTLIVAAIEFLLVVGITQSAVIRSVIFTLYEPPLGVLVTFMIAACVGALAVYLLERLYPHSRISAGILWALVLCLTVVLALKTFLPLEPILISLNEVKFIAIILGIFWKGKPYWR